jgi:hypothetical protein
MRPNREDNKSAAIIRGAVPPHPGLLPRDDTSTGHTENLLVCKSRNIDYSPKQRKSVFVLETYCDFCKVGTEY